MPTASPSKIVISGAEGYEKAALIFALNTGGASNLNLMNEEDGYQDANVVLLCCDLINIDDSFEKIKSSLEIIKKTNPKAFLILLGLNSEELGPEELKQASKSLITFTTEKAINRCVIVNLNNKKINNLDNVLVDDDSLDDILIDDGLLDIALLNSNALNISQLLDKDNIDVSSNKISPKAKIPWKTIGIILGVIIGVTLLASGIGLVVGASVLTAVVGAGVAATMAELIAGAAFLISFSLVAATAKAILFLNDKIKESFDSLFGNDEKTKEAGTPLISSVFSTAKSLIESVQQLPWKNILKGAAVAGLGTHDKELFLREY